METVGAPPAGGCGPASATRSASPGRGCTCRPTLPPAWTLLVADETGLPALLAIVETLPAGHRAIALAEVADERERQEVETAADVAWHWTLRGDRAPGTTSLLLDAARELELPAGPGQAWGGGEALAIRDVRRHLAGHCPDVASSMRLLGYWKHRSTPDDVE